MDLTAGPSRSHHHAASENKTTATFAQHPAYVFRDIDP